MNKEKKPRIRVSGMITRGEKLLLINHVRNGLSYYLLPGGGLEWGETCQEALEREFMEELSIRVKTGKLLCLSESISPDNERHIVNLTYRASLLPGQKIQVNTDKRIKGACWMNRQELKHVIFYPAILPEIIKAWDKGFKSGAVQVNTPWK